MTINKACEIVIRDLGGRARLYDIYPRVKELVEFTGKTPNNSIRCELQQHPKLFRPVEGMKGWWELVSYQEELAAKDRKIAELSEKQITKEVIITCFKNLDTLLERTYAKLMMQQLFGGNKTWNEAYKEMKLAGYFKEKPAEYVLNNPQFDSLYEIKGNSNVNIGNLTNGEK